GFLVRLFINPDLSCEWQPVPYVQSEAQPGVSRMPPEREQKFLKTLTGRSEAIKQKPDCVKRAWEEYCTENHNYFMSSMLGHNRLLRRLNRNSGAIARLHSDENLLLWINVLRCDIHRETALTVLSRHFALKNGLGVQSSRSG